MLCDRGKDEVVEANPWYYGHSCLHDPPPDHCKGVSLAKCAHLFLIVISFLQVTSLFFVIFVFEDKDDLMPVCNSAQNNYCHLAVYKSQLS